MYDPEVGIWMSSDPMEVDWNTYAYCGGDPVNNIDPFGLNPIGITVAMVMADVNAIITYTNILEACVFSLTAAQTVLATTTTIESGATLALQFPEKGLLVQNVLSEELTLVFLTPDHKRILLRMLPIRLPLQLQVRRRLRSQQQGQAML
jgi:hypothetical protein